MKQFNKLHHSLLQAVLFVAAAITTLVGCTEVDDTLGSNLIPDDQQLKAGFVSLPDMKDTQPKHYIETRLFQTDSVLSSNLTQGYMGTMLNDTVGLRTAGFISQFATYYRIDSGYFGYRPIFDSIQLALDIVNFGDDTISTQQFEIYEVISNNYIYQNPIPAGKTERDSSFYFGFNPEKVAFLHGRSIVDSEPLFTFELGGKVGPSTHAVTLNPTQKGKDYVLRLMLQKGDYKGDYSIYNPDSTKRWGEAFKGIYIKPVTDPSSLQGGSTKGTIYTTSLQNTALSIYGRNRVEEDPTLIKDTIGMVFYLYDQQRRESNISINTIQRDYAQATSPAKINPEDVKEPLPGEEDRRPLNNRVYVEGMGGVTTEMTLTPEFFADLERIIDRENELTGQNFRTMAFNQAMMFTYFPSSFYRWEDIDAKNPGNLICEMNAAPKRLGMYTDFKKQDGIVDYAYLYEQSYGLTLAYGGYVNRSRGCYTMDITNHIQKVWNNYLEAKVQAGIERSRHFKDITPEEWSKIKWDDIEARKIYIAPAADDLYTPSFTILQGSVTESGSGVQNNAPIRFELNYNLVK